MPHPPLLPSPAFPGETIIFRVRPSFIPTFFTLLGVAILGLILILVVNQAQSLVGPTTILIIQALIALIVGFALLVIFLNWLTTFYTLTNKRVDERFGIIGQHSDSVTLDRISDVNLKIGLIALIFGYGDIQITSDNDLVLINFRQIGQTKFRASQIEAAIA